MMPGIHRRARLVTDWTVGLLFGRDSSELGQLGHPPQLAEAGLAEQSVRRDRSGRPRPPGGRPGALSLAALALVLGSAAVHALWNALLADSEDTHGTTAVMLVAGVVLFAPVAALTWDVDGDAIPYVLASGDARARVLRAAGHGLLPRGPHVRLPGRPRVGAGGRARRSRSSRSARA